MMRHARFLPLVIVGAGVAACAGGPGSSSGTPEASMDAQDRAASSKNSIASQVDIPYVAAEQVFHVHTLPRYAARTQRAYKGVEKLPADAQGALDPVGKFDLIQFADLEHDGPPDW